VCKQLKEYFSGERTVFNLPLAPQGTPFQQEVWQALTSIKQGDTQSYLWIAKKINNEKAVRAVGAANGKNPIALIIPCHRVIGANGKLTGYAGGLGLKAKLLMHEKAHFTV
jgi:methylated-DNA-[protein]-cysteine S-methyltransferase